MAINDKRLHIHSLPLALFVLAATIVGIVSVNTWRMAPVIQAMGRPAVRFAATDHGFVKVDANEQLADEPPGARIDGFSKDDQAVMRTSQAADSIGLQMALDRAVK